MRLSIYHISGLHKASDSLALFEVSHAERPRSRFVPLGALPLVTLDVRGSVGVLAGLTWGLEQILEGWLSRLRRRTWLRPSAASRFGEYRTHTIDFRAVVEPDHD